VPDLSRTELAAYGACALLVALLGWRALRSEAPAGTASASSPPAHAAAPGAAGAGVAVHEGVSDEAVVDVVGAVRRPGVYTLRTGQRVQDAIRRAGGPRPGADLQAVNLAAKVADAQQIVVPRRAGAGAVAASPGGAAGAGAVPGGAPVSLNTATLEQLDTLAGVGPATAQKILEFRQQHGGFGSVDDLAQVSGIGPKRLEALRTQVQL
jgi:competence protein ComEA